MMSLGDGAQQELSALEAFAGQGVPIAGPVSLGELASNGNGTLQVFNKTIITGAVHAR